MQKSFSLPFTLSLMMCTFIIGLAGGYYISPSYQQTMYQKQGMGLGPADAFVDLRYINAMATHHRGAMLLADQIKETATRQEIRSLAQDILKNEPVLIDELYTWKQTWYKDSRPAPQPIVAQLGTKNDTIDLRFLNALIGHHEAGIEMTQEIRTKSSRNEVLDNADAVEQFLKTSLLTLKQWRTQWYNIQ